jgi:hypothetical protein
MTLKAICQCQSGAAAAAAPVLRDETSPSNPAAHIILEDVPMPVAPYAVPELLPVSPAGSLY